MQALLQEITSNDESDINLVKMVLQLFFFYLKVQLK
jgi:hypothetical protein